MPDKILLKDVASGVYNPAYTDPKNFTDKYNTPIPPDKQAAFDSWVKQRTKATGRNPLGDKYDYDVNGYFLSTGGATDARGHGTDQFKKPNHPTFSNESQYHGLDGYTGGSWGQDKNGNGTYMPSPTNLQFRNPLELTNYFKQVEPGTTLLTPPPVPIPQPNQSLSLMDLMKYGGQL